MTDPPTPPRRIPVTAGSEPTPEIEELQVTVYEAVGGQEFFDRLVDRFYDHVAADDVLLRLYPDPVDLAPAREHLALFLGQYWGGPQTYSQQRGHPRLRMRHNPFVIGPTERDHWLAAMNDAVEESMAETALDGPTRVEVQERMRDYFANAAEHLVNAPT